MTTYNLSLQSAAIRQGDVLCLNVRDRRPTKATDAALTEAGETLGIAAAAAVPGQLVSVVEQGQVSNAVTGLGAGAATEVVVGQTARCTRKTANVNNRFVVGSCDALGNMVLLKPARLGVGFPPVMNVREFGAVGDDQSDDSNAFEAALRAMALLGGTTGVTLFVPPGTYKLSRPLIIERTCIILGAGGHMEAPASRLHVDKNVSGIVLQGFGTGMRADSTQIRNLYLYSDGKIGAGVHGITARCRFHLENVWIEQFSGNGVDIYGSMSGESNSNDWYIANCRISRCGGHGLYLDGPDSNAGIATMLDCSNNDGWGVFDSSFLGNTYVACHAAANLLGPYKTDDVNQNCVFVGCYSEEHQPPSEIEHRSLVIGGLHGAGVKGSGFYISGATNTSSAVLTPFEVPIPTQNGNSAIGVGSVDVSAATYLSFLTPGSVQYETKLKYMTAGEMHAALSGNWIGFSSYPSAVGWSLVLPQSIFSSYVNVGILANSQPIQKVAGTSPAFPSGGFRWGQRLNLFALSERQDGKVAGTYEVGDILFNRWANDPASPWIGWIGAFCIESGTAGDFVELTSCISDNTNVVQLSTAATDLASNNNRGAVLVIDGNEFARRSRHCAHCQS
jgi:Pectate lyase superfamily protein